MTSFFSAEGGPIWIKFRRLVQNDMSTVAMWSKSKPDAEFRYGGRLRKFNGTSSQSHLPHCRVLPPGEFNVMIPELCVTMQGAATGPIQWHVIPEPRITLQGVATWWIHCHDSRATRHITGCSHLAKSMSRSCHIAGCKNSIRHIENRFSPYFTFLFLMQFRLWRAAAFVSSPIHLFNAVSAVVSICSARTDSIRGRRGWCTRCQLEIRWPASPSWGDWSQTADASTASVKFSRCWPASGPCCRPSPCSGTRSTSDQCRRQVRSTWDTRDSR